MVPMDAMEYQGLMESQGDRDYRVSRLHLLGDNTPFLSD